MICIIAGSRTITNYEFVESIISKCPFKDEITEVFSGGCKGIDLLGERWAKSHNIPIKRFTNQEMARRADSAIIIHKDESKGTQHMKDLADQYGLKTYYVPVRPKESFSLAQLKELEAQLEGKGMVGGDLVRRILGQFIKQLEEYQQIAHDARLLWDGLASVEYAIDWEYVNEYTRDDLKKALETPTAKFIEGLVKEQNERSISKETGSCS